MIMPEHIFYFLVACHSIQIGLLTYIALQIAK